MAVETSRAWRPEEVIEGLTSLQDQYIDLIPVLERFTPNHVHWPRKYQPWYFRFRPGIFECFPLIDEIIKATYSTHLGLRGLPAQSIDTGGQLIFPKKGSKWPTEKVLIFPWIDFIVLPKSTKKGQVMFTTTLNTTRIAGSIYQINILYIDHLTDDFFLIKEDQELIASMQTARV